MSQRSDWRGSPDANSTRLALRTCSMVATNTETLSRCVLRCPGRRCCRSALIPSAQTAIPLVPPTCRSRSRKEAETLNHTQIPAVNRAWGKLMDGEGRQSPSEVILWAVRWYLMFPISYRDLELMLADHGVGV